MGGGTFNFPKNESDFESEVNEMNQTAENNMRVKIGWRMERLPSSTPIMFLAILLIVSYFVESIDSGAIGYFLPIIAQEYKLSPAMMGYVGTMSTVGIVVGAIISGIFADMIGRKKIIIVSMFIWGVFGILLATSKSIEMFMIARIGIGVGLGAQIPTTTTMLAEIVPARLRAVYITTFMAMTPLGAMVAGGLSYFFIPVIGWRGVAVVEALFCLFAFVLVKYLPESALWLESKGRFDEADKIIADLEAKVEKVTGKPLPQVEVPLSQESSATKPVKAPLIELFGKEYIRSTIMVTLWWSAILASSMGLSTWFTTLLVAKGFPVMRSIGYVSIMLLGGLFATPIVQYLLKKFGRKWTTALMAALIAVAAYFYGISSSLTVILIFGFFYQMTLFGSAMTNNVYTPELFPTRIRGTAMGYAATVGRFGGLLGPIAIGYIMQGYGVNMVFYFAVGLNLFCAVVIGLLGVETGKKVFTD